MFTILPTRVGVFPSMTSSAQSSTHFPHTSGGVSECENNSWLYGIFSPHEWGCFLRATREAGVRKIFPTQVGVFPRDGACGMTASYFPHTSGGVSEEVSNGGTIPTFSPHEWGCFRRDLGRCSDAILPTRVGVFLTASGSTGRTSYFPHIGGGVSHFWDCVCGCYSFSPHKWGCFYANRLIRKRAIILPT